MQKPIEGVYPAAAKKIESRVTIGEKHSQNHVENDESHQSTANHSKEHEISSIGFYVPLKFLR